MSELTFYLLSYSAISMALTALAGAIDRTMKGPVILGTTQRHAAFMVFAIPVFSCILLYYFMLPLAWVVKTVLARCIETPKQPQVPSQEILPFLKEQLHDDPRLRPN